MNFPRVSFLLLSSQTTQSHQIIPQLQFPRYSKGFQLEFPSGTTLLRTDLHTPLRTGNLNVIVPYNTLNISKGGFLLPPPTFPSLRNNTIIHPLRSLIIPLTFQTYQFQLLNSTDHISESLLNLYFFLRKSGYPLFLNLPVISEIFPTFPHLFCHWLTVCLSFPATLSSTDSSPPQPLNS